MITVLIVLLLMTTCCLIAFKRINIGLIFLLIAVLCFLASGFGILSSFLLDNLESFYPSLMHPKWKENNAIVILGGGTVALPLTGVAEPTILSYARIYEAARLYMLCKKNNSICKIIISGGDPLMTGQSEAAVYQNKLIAIGIIKSDIILESSSMNTYQNAKFTSYIIKKRKFDNIFLVTSGIHMKRALLYFVHFGIYATPAASDYINPQLSIIPLGYNFAITDFTLHEHIGILKFYIKKLFLLRCVSDSKSVA